MEPGNPPESLPGTMTLRIGPEGALALSHQPAACAFGNAPANVRERNHAETAAGRRSWPVSSTATAVYSRRRDNTQAVSSEGGPR